MVRTRLADRKLPDYTHGEEIMNMVTHIVGAALGFVALILCVIFSALRGNVLAIITSIIYGISLILLYTMSSIYHGLRPGMGKKVMQVLDHCTIYCLICGTYTPIVLGPMLEISPAASFVIFGIVYGVSIVATVFTAIDHNRFKVFSMICYIAIGWVVIFALRITLEAVTMKGFIYLLAGGLAYTIGAVIYGIGGKKHLRYMHSIWHIFVLLGSVLQFITIFEFCILR